MNRNRRLLCTALFVTAAAIGAMAEADSTPEASDRIPQAMFRVNPSHSGVYSGKTISKAPSILWQFKTGGKIVSSPAISNGFAYFGSYDGYLYAVQKDTGKLHWKFKTQDRIRSSPALSDNTVYFASTDGFFYALDAQTGDLKWSFKTADESTHYRPFTSDEIPDEFYIGMNEDRNSRIYDPWDIYYSSPTIVAGAVYFGAYDGSVYALDAQTGALRWRLQTSAPVRSSPAVVEGTVYIGGFDGNLYAIDSQTGQVKWKNSSVPPGWDVPDIFLSFVAPFISSPAVANGMVYIGGRDAYLHAVDGATGQTAWLSSHDGSWAISSPAVKDGLVFTGTSDGRFVQGVNAATGQEKWRFGTAHNVFSSPAIVDGTVYVTDTDPYQFGDRSFLYAIDSQDGTERWRFPTSGSVSSPAIKNGTIYFGADDGYLYALQ